MKGLFFDKCGESLETMMRYSLHLFSVIDLIHNLNNGKGEIVPQAAHKTAPAEYKMHSVNTQRAAPGYEHVNYWSNTQGRVH